MTPGRGARGLRWGVAASYMVGTSELKRSGEAGWPAVVGIQYRPFQRRKGGGDLRGRCRLGGGIEEGGAPVRFGYSHTEESGRRRCMARRRRPGQRRLGQDRGRRRPGWAGAGPKGCCDLGQRWNFQRKIEMGCHGHWAELKD
jgi:hypothetical protein